MSQPGPELYDSNSDDEQASSRDRSGRSRRWCFTVFASNLEQSELVRRLDDATTNFYIFQREKAPTTGNEHYQGYVEFKNPRVHRRGAIAGITGHWERARGNAEQNITYCTKPESRLSQPVRRGEPTKQGKRTDLKQLYDDIMERGLSAVLNDGDSAVRAAHVMRWAETVNDVRNSKRLRPSGTHRDIMCLWGAPGTGKTRWVRANYPRAYWKDSTTKWFDGYDGEPTIVFDEFRGIGSEFNLQLWKTLCDPHGGPCKVEIKGRYITIDPERIVICSNRSPDDWYTDCKGFNDYERDAIRRRLEKCRECKVGDKLWEEKDIFA